MSELNKIRNKFAHNVDCVLEEKDVEKLVNLLKIQKDKPIRFQLEKAIDYCIGFLHAWSALIELFPLGMTLVMNKETLFSKDKLFDKKRFSSAYDFNLLSELVTSMKL